MGLFDLFKNKQKEELQYKNYSGEINYQDQAYYMKYGKICRVTAHQAYENYNKISAVGDAVDIIAQNVSAIKPIIVDSDGQIVKNDTVSKLLKSPNSTESYDDFCLNLVINYLLNSNAFLAVTGNVKSAPLGIYNIPNTKVSIYEESNRINYTVTDSGFYSFLTDRFVMRHDSGRAIASSGLKELYHMKGFTQSNNSIEGRSKLESILNDMQVIDNVTKEIVSKHRDGFNAGHLINVDTEDKDSFEQFVKAIKNKFSGPKANGNAMVTMGKSVDIKTIDRTGRDLQSLENKKDSRSITYDRFGIPTALRDQSSQTYNNYQTSLYSLADNTVIPIVKKTFSTLDKIFKHRNLLPEDHFISYDENTIPALQLRRNEELKTLSEVGVLSTNELRTRANYEGIGKEGDQIFIDGSKVPMGSDKDTDDNLEERKKSFYIDLKKHNFSESEIRDFWNEYRQIK